VLVADSSSWRPGLVPRSVRLGFVVDRVVLGKVSLRLIRVCPFCITPHIHSCVICETDNGPVTCHSSQTRSLTVLTITKCRLFTQWRWSVQCKPNVRMLLCERLIIIFHRWSHYFSPSVSIQYLNLALTEYCSIAMFRAKYWQSVCDWSHLPCLGRGNTFR
jgi:hypothetical protein